MDNRPIGVFDSGVGGLTVVNQIKKALPKEQIIYFGDTARVPYGNKSPEAVTKFSLQDMRFLLSKDVKAVIIACNTTSSNSIEDLKAATNVPVIGVIEAGVKAALANSKNARIGVIGTQRTIASNAYERFIKAQNNDAVVFSKACPLFVPLAEEGLLNSEITALGAKYYLQELLDQGIDSLVLGCTHYPLLSACIQQVIGGEVAVIDPAKTMAEDLKQFLCNNSLHSEEESDKAEDIFYVSDNTNMFDFISKLALGKEYHAHLVDIEAY